MGMCELALRRQRLGFMFECNNRSNSAGGLTEKKLYHLLTATANTKSNVLESRYCELLCLFNSLY
jgi:hypothetical protein